MYKAIGKCRICGNQDLKSILNLGEQYLTGVFPKNRYQKITSGPLELVKCFGDNDKRSCGLLQLKHSFDLGEMYGLNYGYRSGLNQSMVRHLHSKVQKIIGTVELNEGDLIIDVGSNDSTLLQGYPEERFVLVGVDPTGKKFKDYYPDYIQLIPDFFSSDVIKKNFGNKKAKVITSIAMFYDLESPVDFMRQIHEVLADDGIWVFEQSYMPAMLEMNAYDTVCHEHLEYYSLKQIKWMADSVGFKIIDIDFNSINGGSFSVTAVKSGSSLQENSSLVSKILLEETNKGLDSLRPYEDFKQRVFSHRDELIRLIKDITSQGKIVFGYGASTKGNVILQFCNFTEMDISFIAEVNKDKFGCYTPGTLIQIISEEEAKAKKPDYFMVLPWHFREGIIQREKKHMENGGKLIMPLPKIEVVGF